MLHALFIEKQASLLVNALDEALTNGENIVGAVSIPLTLSQVDIAQVRLGRRLLSATDLFFRLEHHRVMVVMRGHNRVRELVFIIQQGDELWRPLTHGHGGRG